MKIAALIHAIERHNESAKERVNELTHERVNALTHERVNEAAKRVWRRVSRPKPRYSQNRMSL